MRAVVHAPVRVLVPAVRGCSSGAIRLCSRRHVGAGQRVYDTHVPQHRRARDEGPEVAAVRVPLRAGVGRVHPPHRRGLPDVVHRDALGPCCVVHCVRRGACGLQSVHQRKGGERGALGAVRGRGHGLGGRGSGGGCRVGASSNSVCWAGGPGAYSAEAAEGAAPPGRRAGAVSGAESAEVGGASAAPAGSTPKQGVSVSAAIRERSCRGSGGWGLGARKRRRHDRGAVRRAEGVDGGAGAAAWARRAVPLWPRSREAGRKVTDVRLNRRGDARPTKDALPRFKDHVVAGQDGLPQRAAQKAVRACSIGAATRAQYLFNQGCGGCSKALHQGAGGHSWRNPCPRGLSPVPAPVWLTVEVKATEHAGAHPCQGRRCCRAVLGRPSHKGVLRCRDDRGSVDDRLGARHGILHLMSGQLETPGPLGARDLALSAPSTASQAVPCQQSHCLPRLVLTGGCR